MSDLFEMGEAHVVQHFGVKGMKWGVRKDREQHQKLHGLVKEPIVRTTANGDQFTLSPKAPNKLNTALAMMSKNYRESYNNSAFLSIQDKNGKKIGEAQFWNKNKDDIYLNWITIDKSQRGKGYASEVMRAAVEHGRSKGKKRLILEVPGHSPDARHIYEKLGFKETRTVTSKKADPYWDGLTEMEYRFDKKKGGK